MLWLGQSWRCNRGWQGFVGRPDDLFVALDIKTGKEVCRTRLARWHDGCTITAAPPFWFNPAYLLADLVTREAAHAYGASCSSLPTSHRRRPRASRARSRRSLSRRYRSSTPSSRWSARSTAPQPNSAWPRDAKIGAPDVYAGAYQSAHHRRLRTRAACRRSG
jgi:hypothetical protein